ncbi:MAG: glycosyltransferase [Candidatus Rokubacteria bacterium]|nr:glycosyltransferase [Candidatus Rokubacteria bacterium]
MRPVSRSLIRRLLFGPLYVATNNHPDAYGAHSALLTALRSLDTLTFGGPGADIPYGPSREPLEALFARLPAGWTPDALLWWALEYTVVPPDLCRAPMPSIALLNDWNFNLWGTAGVLGMFDLVLTDRPGARILPGLGYDHIEAWRAHSFDPTFHRRLAGIPRDIDILFVGNLNGEIYRERCRYVARLASLADQYRVAIAGGVHGEPYVRLLNRARIVLNHGYRHELNMRAYEAAACGALLLQERGNELEEIFSDGVHAVFYGEDDLEELLDYYLEHEAARAAVAERGCARIQGETAADHLATLLDRVARLRGRPRAARQFGTLPAEERAWRIGLKAFHSADPHGEVLATRMLATIRGREALSRVSGTLASIFGMGAASNPARSDLASAARQWAARALALDPEDPIHRTRVAELALADGDRAAAIEHFRAATHLPLRAISLPYPYPTDRFRVEWDHAVADAPREFRATLQRLVRARALHRLADVLTGDGKTVEAIARLELSSALAPHLCGNTLALARLHARTGDLEAATERYAEYLSECPLDLMARQELGDALVSLNAPQAEAFLEETLRLLRAMESFEPSGVGHAVGQARHEARPELILEGESDLAAIPVSEAGLLAATP